MCLLSIFIIIVDTIINSFVTEGGLIIMQTFFADSDPYSESRSLSSGTMNPCVQVDRAAIKNHNAYIPRALETVMILSMPHLA